MEAAIAWARENGLHKLSLSVLPNEAALALWRTFAFDVEGPAGTRFDAPTASSETSSTWAWLLTPM